MYNVHLYLHVLYSLFAYKQNNSNYCYHKLRRPLCLLFYLGKVVYCNRSSESRYDTYDP